MAIQGLNIDTGTIIVDTEAPIKTSSNTGGVVNITADNTGGIVGTTTDFFETTGNILVTDEDLNSSTGTYYNNIPSEKTIITLKNKSFELNDKDMFIDFKNNTLVIFELNNIFSLKVYKISSLNIETEAKEPVKIVLNQQKHRILLTESIKPKTYSYDIISTGKPVLINQQDVFGLRYHYKGLSCNIFEKPDNIYIDRKNNVAYICDGESFLEYKIKNFELEIFRHEDCCSIKKNKERKELLIEKVIKPASVLYYNTSANIYSGYTGYINNTGYSNICIGYKTGAPVSTGSYFIGTDCAVSNNYTLTTL